jgi:hypothetical protein
LGGISTAVLDTFYGYYTPGKQSKKIVAGIADDVVKKLKEYNACLKDPTHLALAQVLPIIPNTSRSFGKHWLWKLVVISCLMVGCRM